MLNAKIFNEVSAWKAVATIIFSEMASTQKEFKQTNEKLK